MKINVSKWNQMYPNAHWSRLNSFRSEIISLTQKLIYIEKISKIMKIRFFDFPVSGFRVSGFPVFRNPVYSVFQFLFPGFPVSVWSQIFIFQW